MVAYHPWRSVQVRTRRTFTRELKRETACLVLDQGFSIKEVCEQFDLQDGALMRWVNQVKLERNGGIPETAVLRVIII